LGPFLGRAAYGLAGLSSPRGDFLAAFLRLPKDLDAAEPAAAVRLARSF